MATAIELLIKAKNDSNAAFDALAKQLNTTAQNTKKAGDAAQKLDKQYSSTSLSAGKFADAVGKTSTTLARSADAFGLSSSAMRQIGDVADVAQLGFDNLSKSAAGFNVASIAVVGAGFAIGTMLGNLILQIPGVTEAMDDLAAGTVRLFGGGIVKSTQEVAAANANWAMEQKKVNAAYEELLRSQVKGLTYEQARAKIAKETAKTGKDKILQELKDHDDAVKKAQEAAKRQAEAANRVRDAWLAASERARAEWDRFYNDMHARGERALDDIQKSINKTVAGIAEAARLALDAEMDRLAEAGERGGEMFARVAQGFQDEIDANRDAVAHLSDVLHGLGAEIGGAFGAALDIGGSALDLLLNLGNQAVTSAEKIHAMANALGAIGNAFKSGSVLGGAAGGAAAGAAFGPWGAAIGGLVGGLAGLFGGASKARKEMEALRSQFIQSQGGITALGQKAREAGVSLDAMFNAKNANQLQSAIAAIKSQLDTWTEAQDAVKEAAERYGLTIAELGPKFAQQELDKMALQLIKDYEVLKASGADMVAVLAKMGPEFAKYVDQVIAAGGTVPEALKPIIDQLAAEGKLVHANGEAYTEAEIAAIKYGKSNSEMMEQQLDYIRRIAEAIEKLAGIKVNPIKVPIEPEYAPGFPGGGGGGNHHGGPGGDFPQNALGGITAGPHLGWIGEKGPEALIPLDERTMAKLGRHIAAAMSSHGGGGSGPVYVHNVVELDGAPLDRRTERRMRQRGVRSPAQQRGLRGY